MHSELFKWFVSVVTSTAFLSTVGYFLRDSIGKYFTKSIEHNFETKIEKFKSEMREGEKELEQIRGYISSLRTSRDSVLQTKRFEAAENLIKVRKFLSSLTIAVQYMQMLNVDKIMKMGDDQRINDFMDTVVKPLNLKEKLDEYNSFDKDTMKLYLNDDTINTFEVYEAIMMHTTIALYFLSLPLTRTYNFLKEGEVSKKIIPIIPGSDKLFEKHGESYICYYHAFFYADILKKLRSELIGGSHILSDARSAEKLALDFKEAKTNIQKNLSKYGLSEDLINESIGGDDK
ncbi:MAG: hypothetical protein E7E12_26015 [Klebsiella sp.]|uniref:hypothetical protein n=1 Tax=Klebsiella sp. TaxID=576 RepID=UPI00236FE97A|nr:hypothetical protein [Klebsiella sp.]EKX7136437.1 hypothetical protein [Klebsiella pneumoniae]MDU2279478.1 hypothetical protein [Klebsiella sp.]HDK6244509.1 hypothetical protein [Klebsiella quasipneumoniae]